MVPFAFVGRGSAEDLEEFTGVVVAVVAAGPSSIEACDFTGDSAVSAVYETTWL
jgi:hypothetical protein